MYVIAGYMDLLGKGVVHGVFVAADTIATTSIMRLATFQQVIRLFQLVTGSFQMVMRATCDTLSCLPRPATRDAVSYVHMKAIPVERLADHMTFQTP